MSAKRRSKSLEEVEVELEYFGLTRQSAAAIVRLANNLKQTRKLRAAHIELLIPGRRLHPPSPLGQVVWNQNENEIEIKVIGKIESLNSHDYELEPASRNEVASSEATNVRLPPKSQSRAAPDTPQPSPFLCKFIWLVPLISSGKDINAIGDAVLSSIDSITLTEVASSVGSLSISQDTPPPRSEPSTNIPPTEAEEEEEEEDKYDTPHNKDDFRWW